MYLLLISTLGVLGNYNPFYSLKILGRPITGTTQSLECVLKSSFGIAGKQDFLKIYLIFNILLPILFYISYVACLLIIWRIKKFKIGRGNFITPFIYLYIYLFPNLTLIVNKKKINNKLIFIYPLVFRNLQHRQLYWLNLI